MNGYVTLRVEDQVEVVSMLSLEAVDRLELEVGSEVYAVIDAADVMVGVPHHKRD